MSMEWLLEKAPGFQAPPDADRGAIFNFTFLWSLFEAQVMGNFADVLPVESADISSLCSGFGALLTVGDTPAG